MNDLQQTSVGTLLKNRRSELGLSIADIAARTHIRSAYLVALEEGRYEVLPGLAYQKGFLRNYAGALGLEADQVLQRWRNETTSTDSRGSELAMAPPPSSKAKPSRRLPRRAVFLALLVFVPVVLSYVFLDHLQEFAAPGAASIMQETKQAGDEPAPSVTVDSNYTPVEIAVDAEPEGARTAAADSPTPITILPDIPAEGGQVRLEALGPLSLEVAVDNRPVQRYVLNTSSALQWDVARSVRLAIDNPAAVKIWFGDVPLDLAGRTEILLQAATAD